MSATIERLLKEAGQNQSWLGGEVARIEGRKAPYSQASVSVWLDRIAEQRPSRVFAVEEAFDLKPGALSRDLGYLPLSARSVKSVREAVAADPRLDDRSRRMILSLYNEAVSG